MVELSKREAVKKNATESEFLDRLEEDSTPTLTNKRTKKRNNIIKVEGNKEFFGDAIVGKIRALETELKNNPEIDNYNRIIGQIVEMETVMENPYILITDKKISNIQEILPLLETLMQLSGKLVIICDDIESEALSTLILNKLRGVLNVVAVKDNHDVKLANSIMRTIQEEFIEKVYITVNFK